MYTQPPTAEPLGLQLILPVVEKVLLSLISRKKHQNEEVDKFLNDYIAYLNPIALMNNVELDSLSDHVFRDPVVRDFVLEATFQIQARLAFESNGKIKSKDIALHLGTALTIDRASSQSSALVPDALTTRLLSHATVVSLLEDNVWLMTCVLLNLIDYNAALRRQTKEGSKEAK